MNKLIFRSLLLVITAAVITACGESSARLIVKNDDEMGTDMDVIGNTGDSGDIGNSGNTTDTGNTSDSGDNGDSADTGDSGNTGNSGNTTDSGDTSDSGDTGDTGDSAAICGNMILESGEDCDDGADGDDADGCTDSCEFSCHANTECDDETGNCMTATCEEIDMEVTPGKRCVEQIDDTDTPIVDAQCVVGSCSSGTPGEMPVENGVSCDNKNNTPGDYCFDGKCEDPICGDGIKGETEECDDGNKSNEDTCLNNCVLNTCGDGFVDPASEECDDGDDDDQNSCTTDCKVNNCGDWVYFNGHCYTEREEYGDEDWYDARNDCAERGAYLVTISSPEENAFVNELNNNLNDPVWIGANDIEIEGDWTWHTDEPWVYDNWGTNEPNNSGNEDCAIMYSSGEWNDTACEGKNVDFDWICEKKN